MARPTLSTARTCRTLPRKPCAALAASRTAADLLHYSLDELRFNLLSPLLRIPPECLICMNEEGAQLRDDSVPHLAMLAGSPESSRVEGGGGASTTQLQRSGLERRLYVFDREHLDADPEEVAQMLVITEQDVLTEAPLNRAFRPTPPPSRVS